MKLPGVKTMSWQKVLLFCKTRIAIPGTDDLTVIAAIDPMTEGLPENHGDTAWMFDGQVGNTAARIKDIRCNDRRGRADIDTGRTATTMILDRIIDGERKIRKDFPDKEIRTRVTLNEIGMLSHPTQAALGRQGFFKNRRTV